MMLKICLLLLLNQSVSLQLRNAVKIARIQTLLNAATAQTKTTVGSADLDWPNLGFEYRQTNSFIKCVYKNGKWGDVEVLSDPYVNIHIGATALHYGQACFEGLKAFQCSDQKVRIFRPQENAARITRSCQRICMQPIPEDLFMHAITTAVNDNLAFVPPYGTGGALYIRPILYGSGPRVGLQPSDEYTFIAMVLPVADYYKGGLKPVHAVVVEDFDRAAPRGVGDVKVAGNYAADLLPNMRAKKAGYPIALYLDAKTNSYIEEFSTSNFLAVHKNGAYVTPKSDAILPSVTNKSLMQLAADEGIEVQHRKISIDEVVRGDFEEIGACGTAVVLTPVNKVTYKDQVVNIKSSKGDASSEVGPVMKQLYSRVRAIQNGEEKDKFGWMVDC